MPNVDCEKLIQENLISVAGFAGMAALKAPKMAKTEIKFEILTKDEVLPLAEIVGILGEQSAFTAGDAACGKLAHEQGSPIVEVLIGADTTTSDLNWNCGACGFDSCAEFNAYVKKNKSAGPYYGGPSCNWKNLDFGIAHSWACAAAWHMNVENRAQTSYGAVSMMLGHLEGCNVCVGLSLGPCRDQVWYSRPDLKHSFDMKEHEQFMLSCLPQMQVGFTGGGYPMMKHGPVWGAEPKYLKMMEDPEWAEKHQDIIRRVVEVLEREKAKKNNA